MFECLLLIVGDYSQANSDGSSAAVQAGYVNVRRQTNTLISVVLSLSLPVKGEQAKLRKTRCHGSPINCCMASIRFSLRTGVLLNHC